MSAKGSKSQKKKRALTHIYDIKVRLHAVDVRFHMEKWRAFFITCTHTNEPFPHRYRTLTHVRCVRCGVWLYVSYKKIVSFCCRSHISRRAYRRVQCILCAYNKSVLYVYLRFVSAMFFLFLRNIVRFRLQFTYEEDWLVFARQKKSPRKPSIRLDVTAAFMVHSSAVAHRVHTICLVQIEC